MNCLVRGLGRKNPVPRTVFGLAAWGALILGAHPLESQDASRVYDRYSKAVVKVEVLEAGTGAPSSLGTAFFAAPSLLLTNYHVVRNLVFQPTSYRLRLKPTDDVALGRVRIVALDPANDLAVLRVDRVHTSPVHLLLDSIAKGELLYSMGHPADLGTSVVEGVFNGAVAASVAPLFHFSGSLNPGMSGGPTLRGSGGVVGVNVSTAGDQLSFLVPALQGQRLLDQAMTVDSASTEQLMAAVSGSLSDFQDSFFSGLIRTDLEAMTMGHSLVPAGPSGQFDCSADPQEIEGDRYRLTEYRCETRDMVLVGPRGSFPLIYMEHMYMASESLSIFSFQALLSKWYTSVLDWEAPRNRDATSYRCHRANVNDGLSAEMLVVFCARRHGSHEGLYDLFVRSALLGGKKEGVVSTLRATPISYPNAVALTEKWLRGFSWTR